MMEYLLSTNSLTKQYGRHKAVNSVNIHIRQGDIYGLIGRNGAGKTTLLRLISGLASPTEGDFTLFGARGKEACRYLSRVGTLIESPGVYPNMSAADNLRLKCLAMGVRRKNEVEELLHIAGLADTGKKKVKNFSLGMKQRLGIALALVGDPDLVVLDEPINGLDPQGIAEIRDTLSCLNRERNITLIISSHILEELSKIATRYGIIHDGVLLQELTREELLERCSERIELKTDDTRKACTVLERMGITRYKVVDPDTIHIFERLGDSGEITMALAENQIRTMGITVKNEALEDYYLNLTGGDRNA
ncbi:ATP-binding cassette domain-containing protein [Lachnoclostridium sp. An169]|uniref:ATP-binding cassette domain-containing protein n=1 Tax=Lachnoclostridium sp. An169 TaxID=1965569 RepID=UPI001FA93CD8|nr:ATP-binding cassette domain-containing protein [Lachnoclostridium sp. An169]